MNVVVLAPTFLTPLTVHPENNGDVKGGEAVMNVEVLAPAFLTPLTVHPEHYKR